MMWALTLVAEVIGFIVLGAVGLMLLAMAGAYVNDLIRTRPARSGSNCALVISRRQKTATAASDQSVSSPRMNSAIFLTTSSSMPA
jgi:hypothetical protein